MSSAFHWAGTSSCGQQDKLWLTGRNPQERNVFYEAQLLWISWRSSSVTNTTKLSKSPINQFLWLIWIFICIFIPFFLCVCTVAHLGTQRQEHSAPEQVWCSGRGGWAPVGVLPKIPRISEWQKHSATSQSIHILLLIKRTEGKLIK